MEIGIRELRDHLSQYVSAARDGQVVTVTDHGKAVAQLVGLHRPRKIDELIAEGLIIRATKRHEDLSLERVDSGTTVSDLVAEQRR
ncbi:MAG: type II toxin-antitoxin system prevent-host-death family antitoxin [Actinobacteria bacterium]|nr:type II toxin-antitoxin system prevent-host-death family antitoxin [Actinomycetota bacterium]